MTSLILTVLPKNRIEYTYPHTRTRTHTQREREREREKEGGREVRVFVYLSALLLYICSILDSIIYMFNVNNIFSNCGLYIDICHRPTTKSRENTPSRVRIHDS